MFDSEDENVAALLLVLNDLFESEEEEEEEYKRQRQPTKLYIKNRVYFGAYHKLMQLQRSARQKSPKLWLLPQRSCTPDPSGSTMLGIPPIGPET